MPDCWTSCWTLVWTKRHRPSLPTTSCFAARGHALTTKSIPSYHVSSPLKSCTPTSGALTDFEREHAQHQLHRQSTTVAALRRPVLRGNTTNRGKTELCSSHSSAGLPDDQHRITRQFHFSPSLTITAECRDLTRLSRRLSDPAARIWSNGQPLAFLDNAASTQRPSSVIQAISECYESYPTIPTSIVGVPSSSAKNPPNAMSVHVRALRLSLMPKT